LVKREIELASAIIFAVCCTTADLFNKNFILLPAATIRIQNGRPQARKRVVAASASFKLQASKLTYLIWYLYIEPR
jgi:hypothetical protein